MKSAKKHAEQVVKKKIGKTPNPWNHWVIQVGEQEPFYFIGNEQKAEDRRMYHGVKYHKVSWKRLATPEEIEKKTALSRIKKQEIAYTPKKPRANYIKKYFPEATDEEIQSARDKAQKVMEKNTKISDTHHKKIEQWNRELAAEMRQRKK